MLLIKTRVGSSAIHGMGLFALEAVPRGTAIWRFEAGFDREVAPEQYEALPELAQRHLRWFAYRDPDTGNWVLSGDHACFMNHASAPNTGAAVSAPGPITTLALQDIAAGTELTCDYFAFDAEARDKLAATQ